MAATVLTPSQAAEQLGVKAVTLRRYALAYERVFGPLERDPQDNRLYDAEALERLLAARALVDERRAPSLEVALQSLSGAKALERREDLGAKIDALAEMVRQLHEDNLGLRQELGEIRKALPAPQEQPHPTEPPPRPWWKLW
jgi:DNA-binding transcriptional MerR regulator